MEYMEYMEQQMQTAMKAAEASYRRDAMFRRYVDWAAKEAMTFADHIEGEPDRRDMHQVAVTAALAALRLAIDGDHVLKSMEAERDAYKNLAEKGMVSAPLTHFKLA